VSVHHGGWEGEREKERKNKGRRKERKRMKEEGTMVPTCPSRTCP
jgi:hypothetical protein